MIALSASAVKPIRIHISNGGEDGFSTVDYSDNWFRTRISCVNPGVSQCPVGSSLETGDNVDQILSQIALDRIAEGKLTGNVVLNGKIVVWAATDIYNLDIYISNFLGIIPIIPPLD